MCSFSLMLVSVLNLMGPTLFQRVDILPSSCRVCGPLLLVIGIGQRATYEFWAPDLLYIERRLIEAM
jgi:hypothetical protein